MTIPESVIACLFLLLFFFRILLSCFDKKKEPDIVSDCVSGASKTTGDREGR